MDVLVLVCAAALSAPACQKDTSIHAFYAPDPQTDASACLRHGMLYASESRLVGPGDYVKVVCVPPHRTAARASG